MTKQPAILILAATALCALTGCQTPTTPVGFLKADANLDGKLSRDESSDYFVAKIFEGLDQNNDQKLTWEEWKVEGVKGARGRFTARDTNHDGAVTLEEAKVGGQHNKDFDKAFRQADKNKDGSLTLEETQAYYASKEGPVR